jgi:nucleotide-binding universal stress UspA family protein
MTTRIVVTTDGSALSERAVPAAAMLAGRPARP